MFSTCSPEKSFLLQWGLNGRRESLTIWHFLTICLEPEVYNWGRNLSQTVGLTVHSLDSILKWQRDLCIHSAQMELFCPELQRSRRKLARVQMMGIHTLSNLVSDGLFFLEEMFLRFWYVFRTIDILDFKNYSLPLLFLCETVIQGAVLLFMWLSSKN